MLLIEAASNVQAPVLTLATQVKPNFVWAVLAFEAPALDGVQSTRITPHPALMQTHSHKQSHNKKVAVTHIL